MITSRGLVAFKKKERERAGCSSLFCLFAYFFLARLGWKISVHKKNLEIEDW
jgi:hypothetical protein